MSIDNLIAATEAMNALTARMAGFMDGVDADLAAHQAAYAALSGNLKNVVNKQMYFTATIDPDDPAPTNVDGGTFNTMKAAVEAAPAGSIVELFFMSDKTHPITNMTSYAQAILLRATGAGARPELTVGAYSVSGYNLMHTISMFGFGTVRAAGVNIRLPTAKPDAGLPWASQNSLLRYGEGVLPRMSFYLGTVSGGEGCSLLRVSGGGIGDFAIYNATLDGPIFGVSGMTSGAAIVAKANVTLLNGAALTDGGTLGTNLLQN